MKATKARQVRAKRRVRRVRKKVIGTPERPRLAVARSHKNIEAQLIDDVSGKTLCSVGSRAKDARSSAGYGGNTKAAAVIGKMIGEKAAAAGIKEVAFDRRGYRYHGRIKALADAAREAGLKF